jgi:hypothetical protein
VVGLHHAVLGVLTVAAAEFALWFVAYVLMNESGMPYCCPFPAKVVGALVLQIFRQSFSRVLLLVVALGYGIVRPRLLTMEWAFVGIIGGGYLVSAIVAEVSQIVMFQESVKSSALRRSKYYSVPEIILDIVLLSWIYLALTNTMRILRDFKQTHKLRLYRALYTTIGVFVVLFCLVTLLAVLAESKVISWPWQLAWLLDALWESLNVAVLVAIAYICVPYGTSHLLAYSAQLPTFDPDEDGVYGDGDSSDESDDYNSDDDNISNAFGGGSRSGKSSGHGNSSRSSSGSNSSSAHSGSGRGKLGFTERGLQDEDGIEDLDADTPIAGSSVSKSTRITTSSSSSTSRGGRQIEMASKLGATRNALLSGKHPSALAPSNGSSASAAGSSPMSQAERHRRIVAAAEAARRSVRSQQQQQQQQQQSVRDKKEASEYSLPLAGEEG